MERHHREEDVRREEEEREDELRGGASDEDGQRDDAGASVRVDVARVVAVEDRFGVESERDSVEEGDPGEDGRLRDEREEDGQRPEGEQDDDVTERHVLQSEPARVEEARRQPAEEDEGQLLDGRRGEEAEEEEPDAADQVEEAAEARHVARGELTVDEQPIVAAHRVDAAHVVVVRVDHVAGGVYG